MPTISEIYKTIQAEDLLKKATQMEGKMTPQELNQLGLTSTPILEVLAYRSGTDHPTKTRGILAICRVDGGFLILRAVEEPLSTTGWVRLGGEKPGSYSQQLPPLYKELSAQERAYLGIKDSELVDTVCSICSCTLPETGPQILQVRVGRILNVTSSICDECTKPLSKALTEILETAIRPKPPDATGLGRNIIL